MTDNQRPLTSYSKEVRAIMVGIHALLEDRGSSHFGWILECSKAFPDSWLVERTPNWKAFILLLGRAAGADEKKLLYMLGELPDSYQKVILLTQTFPEGSSSLPNWEAFFKQKGC
jgi:hypothetical protein